MPVYGSIPKVSPEDANTNHVADNALNHVAKTEEETPLLPPASSAAMSGNCCSGDSEKSLLSNLWTNLVFNWFTPVLYRGNDKKKLDPEDMDLVPFPHDCDTHCVAEIFYEHWRAEIARAKKEEEAANSTTTGTSSEQQQQQQSKDDKKKKKPPTPPSLVIALAKSFGREFMLAGLLKLVHDACIFVGPQVLNAMIYYLRNAKAPMSEGLGLTALVTVSQLAMSFCLRHYFFSCYMVGLKLRTAVVVAVYEKALVLAAGERQTRTVGEITNLMSIDAKRLQDLTSYLHAIWYTVFQITLALFFLFQQLGASCLGGVVVMIIMMPVTKTVAQWMGRRQKRVMKAKDERVEINSEVMSNIKVIKLQAWEESFQNKILRFRATEMSELWTYYVGSAASAMLWNSTPVAVAVATFAAYVLSGNELEVASALTALALFDILRFPLFMLPQIVNRIVEAGVSMARIRSFLLCKEHEPIPPGLLQQNGVDLSYLSAAYETRKPRLQGVDPDPKTKELLEAQWDVALLKSQLEDAEQKIRDLVKSAERQKRQSTGHESLSKPEDWEDLHGGGGVETMEPVAEDTAASDIGTAEDGKDPERGVSSSANLLCLRRVNFQCNEGELIAVVGFVGSGKSTLINTILGEVRVLAGTSAVRGSLSYFSQSPFILNATIRDNILFGHVNDDNIDEERYQRALECCALAHDLKMLSHGDMTEIGERGVTLSGGQKARVALARAVYHNADVSLIDDALSAVDAHVAKHLFHECIAGELLNSKADSGKKRSVILVTNALQYLSHPRVNKIVVINDGRIAEQGTHKELASAPDSLFARFLAVIEETGIKGGDDAEEDSVEDEEEAEEVDKSERRSSISKKRRASITDSTRADKEKKTQLMTEEARSTGHVGLPVYLAWAKAAGGYWVPFAIVLIFGSVEGMNVLSKWWLTYWSSHASGGSQMGFLEIYALINLGFVISTFFAMVLLVTIGMRASQNFFAHMLDTMMRVPMSFFDTTPIGRIINRFSKDMYTIDEELVMTLRMYIRNITQILSTIMVISGVSPVFTASLIPIILFYIRQQAFFTITYRELKRLDSVYRSPLYALLGETVDGVASIRAFSAQNALMTRLKNSLDKQQHAYYLTCSAQCWLAVRLELVGTLIITFACLCAVAEHASVNGNETQAGLFGLAISFSLSITQSLNWSVRMASDFEAQMVAVERVKDYCDLTEEADRKCDDDDRLMSKSGTDSWPRGEIIFDNAKLRYRSELPLVLKGLDIHIPAGSKVGIVGRTGAGKSTLMIALLRLVELDSGRILMDGVDASTVGLALLRSKIAVIPQDPVLFSGTIRSNLDPFQEFSDETLYGVLHRVGLFFTSSTENGRSLSSASLASLVSQCAVQSLEDTVSEGGINYSVGQRQLVVIARALLCRATIVIMDEATAAVDADTDARIQTVMRTEFVNATCLTVAHRLNTIMDSDLILVMDDGRAAEFDKPKALLGRGGMFRDLVQASKNTGM
ncbi:Multiple drug resistance-associated protein-like transporter 1 [Seminavis robusta]|uniref:Multiple drug resistance-associated protein-like transporter 1 n=1 Tax=Seminavis robusta TaxID=568900 RepID=A0A9N8EP43_9STRA|nr:Multiple drug resistance-associated protein-like transporter 1 [Seminavis robusta]|eukprot:Sro1322_g262550.1 Multiple drug resistance-associated protein-like transporter 1 (1491) ;mRNA; r:1447-6978